MRARRAPIATAGIATAGIITAMLLAAVVAPWLSRRLPVGFPLGPRPGDPALVEGDPRLALCDIAADDTWLAFTMRRASDVSLHFPGWSEGIPELGVGDPALAVMSRGVDVPTTGYFRPDGASAPPRPLYYQVCIAVGEPSAALAHHYGWTRFDTVRPVLDGPLVLVP